MKCHQRKIREQWDEKDPRPTVPLKGCRVKLITREQAKPIILKYEWLGTMGKAEYCVGLISPDDELLGVNCFGQANGTKSHNICGEIYKNIAICLERGACVHYAHKHAGSFLTASACRLLAKETNKRIFFAYHDQEAGEIGTIYQACNWIYLGISPGRKGNSRKMIIDTHTGEEISTRTARGRGLYMAEVSWNPRYKTRIHNDKGKYVWFEGSKTEKKKLKAALCYEIKPYPKR